MHLSTQAIFYSIRIVSSILRFCSHEIHRLDAKLLLEALGKIARTAETYHIADFADAVVSFFQELCALLQFHELDHLVWRNIGKTANLIKERRAAYAHLFANNQTVYLITHQRSRIILYMFILFPGIILVQAPQAASLGSKPYVTLRIFLDIDGKRLERLDFADTPP